MSRRDSLRPRRTRAAAAAEAPAAQLSLDVLAPDLLAAVCLHIDDDRDVLCALASVSRSLRAAIHRPEIVQSLAARAQARLKPLLQSAAPFIDGCACLMRREHTPAALRAYFESSVDYSRGTELHPLTISTVLSIRYAQQEIRFHSQLPPELVNGTFRYEAGPWPAAFALQVYRAGGPMPGLGFGVRTLEPIGEGDVVCHYWGDYQWRDEPVHVAEAQNYGEGVPEPTPYTLFGDGHDRHTRSVSPSEVAVRGFVNPTGIGQFRIDASSFGNVARWINHAPMVRDGDGPVQNLKAILSRDPASPNEHKWKVSFCALRDIAPGEPLWWNYFRSRNIRKRAPATGGVLHPYEMCGDAETLRCAATGAPLRADWLQCGEERWPSEGILIQGYPPYAPPPGEPDLWEDEMGDWRDHRRRYNHVFPLQTPELLDAPWEHDEDASRRWQAASPPIDASTPERSAYWAAGCKWYSLA